MTLRKTLRPLGRPALVAFVVACGLALPPARGETDAASPPPAAAPAPLELPDPTRFARAVEQGDLDGVEAWLAAGLPADFAGDRIGSGLMIAAWEGHVSMMDLFVRHGARIDLTNRHDEQALQLAAWRGHLDAVEWLLDHGAAPHRPGARWTALHYAAFANRPEIARRLIERGAEVNARAPNGSTVLMMAAREGHADLARQLIEAGADAKAVNDHGDSALTWAMRHEHYSIAQMVSSQAEFAHAAKATSASFGAPVRSIAAPPEIEEILRRLRLAEAAGQPTEKLREALSATVERFKQESRRIVIDTPAARKRTARGKPGALLITARRVPAPGPQATSGERAELVYSAPAQALTPDGRDAPSEISDILARMQRAQAAGQPVDRLREALYQAVARAKNPP